MLEIPSQLEILPYSPKLEHTPAREVLPEDVPRLPRLIKEMVRLCKQYDGEGIAAPQVGVFLRLAVVLNDNEIIPLVNPRITSFGGKDLLDYEGCLTFPPCDTNQARVWRSESIHLENGTLKDPTLHQKFTYTDWLARVIQHEVDHLNPQGAIFFINRVGPIAKKLVLERMKSQPWQKMEAAS